MTLTAKQINAAKPAQKAYKLSDINGLYLYIAPTGLKSWRANYTVSGKQRTRTYGRWPDLSLAQARILNVKAKDQAKEQAQTTETAAVETFESVAKAWVRLKETSLSNAKHRKQIESTIFKWVVPSIGNLPISEIKRAQLVKIIQSVQATGKLETAHRVAGRITEIFNYAQDAGFLESHPAAYLTRTLQSRRTKQPMHSLPPGEIAQLLKSIADYPEIITRLGLQFVALTFVRSTEMRLMRWDEIVDKGNIWVVPADRMKLRKPHVVPLSRQAKDILKQMHAITGGSDLVFESSVVAGSPISENTLLFALYRLGYRGRMTVHGFRALASTVLNEQSTFDRDVIERQLAHKETDAVRAAYNRAEYLPQRKEMMQWWADWLTQQIAA